MQARECLAIYKKPTRPVHTETRCNFFMLWTLVELSHTCYRRCAQFLGACHVAQASVLSTILLPVTSASEAFDLCMQLVNGVVETNNPAHKPDSRLLRHFWQLCSKRAALRQRIFWVAGSGVTPLCADYCRGGHVSGANSAQVCRFHVIRCSGYPACLHLVVGRGLQAWPSRQRFLLSDTTLQDGHVIVWSYKLQSPQ